MVIEFIGSPGAGKSTLMRAAMEYYRRKGIQVYARWDANRLYIERSLTGRLVRLAPSLLQDKAANRLSHRRRLKERRRFEQEYPDLMDHVKWSQKIRPAEAGVIQRRILHNYFLMVEEYGLLRSLQRPGEVLVFDEGFVHRVVYLNVSHVETPNPLLVKGYLELVPRPDLIIHIHAPKEVCLRRVVQRGLSNYMIDKDSLQLAFFFDNTHAVIQMTLDHLHEKGWPVITVNNGGSDPAIAADDLFILLAEEGRKNYGLF